MLLAAALIPAAHAQSQQTDSDAVSTVSGVTVTGRLLEVPRVGEGAPMYTAEELAAEAKAARLQVGEAMRAALRCDPHMLDDKYSRGALSLPRLYREEQTAQGLLRTAARRAEAATLALTAARIAAGKGEGSAAAIEAAEAARQAAVAKLLERRREVAEARASLAAYQRAAIAVDRGDIPKWMINTEYMTQIAYHPVNGDPFVVPKSLADLQLADLQVVEIEGGKNLRISGRLINPRDKDIFVPTLTFTAVDQFGQKLTTELTDPNPRPRLEAHASVRFAYAFEDPPERTKSVVVAVSNGNAPLEPLPVGMVCG